MMRRGGILLVLIENTENVDNQLERFPGRTSNCTKTSNVRSNEQTYCYDKQSVGTTGNVVEECAQMPDK
jgi:tRNA(Met) C34 N-acetyltransferase TmcA